MIILGVTHPISWNPASAILVDGRLAAMAEEERFNRFKFSPRQAPVEAIRFCLEKAGVTLDEVDRIAVGWERAEGQNSRKRYPWDFLASRFPFDRRASRVVYVRHHLAHAVASFFPSPFDEANLISLDAYGGCESGALGVGREADVDLTVTIPTSRSWGHVYGQFTQALGFSFHRDEGKVMGLAAYGTPEPDRVDFVDWDGPLPTVHPGRFRRFLKKLDRRKPDDPISPSHQNLAATAQWVLEQAVFKMAEYLKARTGLSRYCLSGGTALNCALNGALLGQEYVDSVFVNPAAHDGGTALGAALWVHRLETGQRPGWHLTHPRFGPAYSGETVRQVLRQAGIASWRALDDPAETAARLLDQGKIVGWFQGPLEFGPRALGGRSILADPRSPDMADRVNDLKGRERWRPLAPSILAENLSDYVEGPVDSPFMLLASKARNNGHVQLGAATHVDGTLRHQVVRRDDHPLFWRLLEAYRKRTGCGALLNTSFNLSGQPIVCSPKDAIGTFFASALDALIMEDVLVWKPAKA